MILGDEAAERCFHKFIYSVIYVYTCLYINGGLKGVGFLTEEREIYKDRGSSWCGMLKVKGEQPLHFETLLPWNSRMKPDSFTH